VHTGTSSQLSHGTEPVTLFAGMMQTTTITVIAGPSSTLPISHHFAAE